MKDHSDAFEADAVTLYESTPGATRKSIAADLGVDRATPRERVLRDRERRGVTAADAKSAAQPRKAASAGPGERVRQLEASERKSAIGRDIPRKAARRFAGERNGCSAASGSLTTTGTPTR
ncbi:hypothetical protein ACFW2X_16265 [Streptomyces antibioticus]|uniref:hypothetical protein n=1 Tax=Streptomyces antibioticus TaxID=1890 RepID=UPI0036C2B5CF